MERNLLSFDELLVKVNGKLNITLEEKAKAESINMPAIMIKKFDEEALFWQSLFTAIEEYKHWCEIEDAPAIENLTTGPRITVDNEGIERWNFDNAISATDMVNSPVHYATGRLEQDGFGESMETIDYIYDKLTPDEFRGYIKGNVLKYVSREGKKNGDEDLHKVAFYLNYFLYHKKTDGSKELSEK